MTGPRFSRRGFLVGASGATALGAGGVALDGALAPAAAQEGGLPDYAAWKDADALIIHSKNTMETKRGAVGSGGLTASDRLFIRNNLPSPDASITADPDAWEIAVEGVARPGTMTLGQLKRLGVTSEASVLQCSGNGRGFFSHGASGSQWLTGAAGCVIWTGVPVAAIVEAMGGPAAGATLMTSTGGEALPDGVDPASIMVERSVPIAAHEHAMIAFEMNGAPLPLTHGGPARMVIPGYYGVNNVKYMKRLAFGTQESGAKIQTSGYRVRPVGEGGAASQPSMWDMTVKSWVTHPLTDPGSGRVQIHGVAFAGPERASGVEVSLDGGQSWAPARFYGPDLGRFAWRSFVLEADLAPGVYAVASRATAEGGSAQPEDFPPNERGYGHNGWRAHAVELTVA